MSQPKVYQIITERIVELLQEGVIPWRKTWSGEAFAPRNLDSGKAYRGINAFLLACMPYESPYWITFKQANKLGGSVRKGEKSMPVIYWNWIEKEDPQTGKTVKLPLLRYYRVFHISQCDLPEGKIPVLPKQTTYAFDPIEACETVLKQMPDAPKVQHDSHAAFYRPSTDTVHLPQPERFEQPDYYYATLFHELIHSTGHQSRLAREGITNATKFGSSKYSKEELIAELGAAFLCGHCGIESKIIENSAAYLEHWIKRLQSDHRLIVNSAASAQKAADFCLNLRTNQPFED